jgi:hypothetical protein
VIPRARSLSLCLLVFHSLLPPRTQSPGSLNLHFLEHIHPLFRSEEIVRNWHGRDSPAFANFAQICAGEHQRRGFMDTKTSKKWTPRWTPSA